MPVLIPILLLGGGIALVAVMLSVSDDMAVPNHQPEYPATPGKTGYPLVDKILPQLQQAAQSSGIPLGLIVGWIAKESGGKIGEVTKLGERGFGQLDPGEQKRTGYDDTERLSSDVTYSINALLALIGCYMGDVDRMKAPAPRGSTYYWLLVKLAHTVGRGGAEKWLEAAEQEGVAGSWGSLRSYCTAHDSDLLHATKHSPLKWFPFIDSVYKVGAPFGFGTSNGAMIVGAAGIPGGTVYNDIPDPLDCLT